MLSHIPQFLPHPGKLLRAYAFLGILFITVPAVAQGSYSQLQKIVAADRAVDDFFGFSVAIAGDYAVVGAVNKDGGTGAAYAFTLNNGSWTQQTKLVASDQASGDNFGYSVAISGQTIVVGARTEDEDANAADTKISAGSAYVFALDNGSWVQRAKLVADDRASSDEFGYSIAISGQTIVVGARLEDEDANGGNPQGNAGSAYVFALDNGSWTQQAKLVANDRASLDQFGYSVAISGQAIVVGAINEDEDTNGGDTKSGAGSAYVFAQNNGSWTQQAKLVASDRDSEDQFGYSVATSGQAIVVGARFEDEDANGGDTKSNAGSAYVFAQDNGSWTQQAKLVANDRTGNDEFGYSVAISEQTIVVGARLEDEDTNGGDPKSNAGSAYVFALDNGSWTQQTKLVASDRDSEDRFGISVAISGRTIVVGARREGEDANGGDTKDKAGSAYVFVAPLVPNLTVNEDPTVTPDDLGSTVNLPNSTLTQAFTITNNGDGDATGVAVALDNTGDAGFSIDPGLSATDISSAGGRATFTVLFTPSAATGTFTQTVTISHDEGEDIAFTVSVEVIEAVVFVDDSGAGFATITEALQFIRDAGQPADLYLAAGTYTEDIDLSGLEVRVFFGAPPVAAN
ncbi:MAG: hypothetical protein AAFN92_06735 [Bacteroidota bacterium]